MLKRLSIKKIITSTIVLFIVFMVYLVPTSEKDDNPEIEKQISYVNSNVNTHIIYLMDNNNYISQTKIRVSSKSKEGIARELVEVLIQEGAGSDQIPSGFQSVINSNTKINSIQIVEDTIKIDLSKDFLDTLAELEERTVEALVYTLTSIEGINNVVTYIEGNILTLLPKSNIKLPATLSRDIGINKEYKLTSMKDISYTTVYFVNKYNGNYYYTPVTKVNNDPREKIEIIIDELSSQQSKKNLMSFMNAKTTLLGTFLEENTMTVNFDDNIFNSLDQRDILEEVIYTIAMSIKDNYKVSEIIFRVGEKEITKTVLKSLE